MLRSRHFFGRLWFRKHGADSGSDPIGSAPAPDKKGRLPDSGSRHKNLSFWFLSCKKLNCYIMFWIIVFSLNWTEFIPNARTRLFFAFQKDTPGAALKSRLSDNFWPVATFCLSCFITACVKVSRNLRHVRCGLHRPIKKWHRLRSRPKNGGSRQLRLRNTARKT